MLKDLPFEPCFRTPKKAAFATVVAAEFFVDCLLDSRDGSLQIHGNHSLNFLGNFYSWLPIILIYSKTSIKSKKCIVSKLLKAYNVTVKM